MLEDFPIEYLKIIDSHIGQVRYISATKGSDSNDGLTPSTPYQTLEYARAQTNSITTRVLFVVGAGTYTPPPVRIDANINAQIYTDTVTSTRHRTLLCAPGKTIISWTSPNAANTIINGRDAPAVPYIGTLGLAYGAIFLRDNGGRTVNTSVAFFRSTQAWEPKFENCVLREANVNQSWSLNFDVARNSLLKANNCTFYTTANALLNFSSSSTLRIANSVFARAWSSTVTTGTLPTFVNTVNMQTVDPVTYVTTGQTIRGVHSGTYSWTPTTNNVFAFPGLICNDVANNGSILEGNQVTITYTHTKNNELVPYEITGVDPDDVDIPLTGNITVSNYLANLTFNVVSEFYTELNNTANIQIAITNPNLTEQPVYKFTIIDVPRGTIGAPGFGGFAAGGGGAQGYSNVGVTYEGTGGFGGGINSGNTSIFGGGGGGSSSSTSGGGGGGVGIFGQGSNGEGGTSENPGKGGSGGSDGVSSTGGRYGGGGGGATANGTPGKGGSGAIRIIWPGDQRAFPSTKVRPTGITPTYRIAANTLIVIEGSSVRFNVSTTNVYDETPLYWTTQVIANNVTSADFTDNRLDGPVTLSGGSNTFIRTLTSDGITDDFESFRIQLRLYSNTGPVVANSSLVTVRSF